MLKRLLDIVEMEPRADIVVAQFLAAVALLVCAAVLSYLGRLPR